MLYLLLKEITKFKMKTKLMESRTNVLKLAHQSHVLKNQLAKSSFLEIPFDKLKVNVLNLLNRTVHL